jgi:hypothetical protein
MIRLLRWVSLALCLASAALCAVSLRWSIAWLGAPRTYIVGRGVFWTTPMQFAPMGFHPGFRAVQPGRVSWDFDLHDLGPGHRLSMLRTQAGARYVALWTLPAIAAPLTLGLWLFRWQPAPDACPKCRYDLRGVPPATDSSRRCPECGTLSPADLGATPC